MASNQGSGSGSNGANPCMICHEPLADDVWGLVVPCGHGLHVHCWDGWVASCIADGDDGSGVKCPMCMEVSSTFVRSYVDLGGEEANLREQVAKLQESNAKLLPQRNAVSNSFLSLFTDFGGGAANLQERVATIQVRVGGRVCAKGSLKQGRYIVAGGADFEFWSCQARAARRLDIPLAQLGSLEILLGGMLVAFSTQQTPCRNLARFGDHFYDPDSRKGIFRIFMDARSCIGFFGGPHRSL